MCQEIHGPSPDLAEILAHPAPIVRLYHHNPACRAAWCWAFCVPVMSLVPGPQRLITGETVAHPGGACWSGFKGGKSFPTRSEALAWAESVGLPLAEVEPEPASPVLAGHDGGDGIG